MKHFLNTMGATDLLSEAIFYVLDEDIVSVDSDDVVNATRSVETDLGIKISQADITSAHKSAVNRYVDQRIDELEDEGLNPSFWEAERL